MLSRLLYASRPVQAPTEDDLAQLMGQARQRNEAHGVTGVLVYGDGVYLQVLEGGRGALSALYARLQRDERHRDLQLLGAGDIDQRRFGHWSLGVVNLGRINAGTLLKYSEQLQLDPYRVAAATSLALIEELAATAAIVGHA